MFNLPTISLKLTLIVLIAFVSTISHAPVKASDENVVYHAIYHSAMVEDIIQSNNEESKRIYQKAQNYYQQAVNISPGVNEKARKIMFQHALNSMLSANNLLLKHKLDTSQTIEHARHYQEIQFKQKEKAINSLIKAQIAILKEKNITTEGHIVSQVNKLVAYANDYLENENFTEAHTVLQQSYKLIISSVSALRAGETLVFELNFTTPESEYNYYLAKVSDALSAFKSLAENPNNVDKKHRLTRTHDKISNLIALAEPLANKGEYVSAIKIMEAAYNKMQSGLVVALR